MLNIYVHSFEETAAHFSFTEYFLLCDSACRRRKQLSMWQLRNMLCTVYNDKPQVAPVPHPAARSSFITLLCLFSPCGPFSDWMNWKGWRFELNNTSYSHNPTPHLQIASHPPLSFTQPIVSSPFLSAERVWALCVAASEEQIGAGLTFSSYVRIISIICANSHDSFAPLDLTFEELAGWIGSSPSYSHHKSCTNISKNRPCCLL